MSSNCRLRLSSRFHKYRHAMRSIGFFVRPGADPLTHAFVRQGSATTHDGERLESHVAALVKATPLRLQSMSGPASGQRRRWLAAGGLWAVVPGARAVGAEPPTGWLQLRLPAPPLQIIGADGRRQALTNVVAGKVTAVQLMFTGCSSTCPTQGALFAAVAPRLKSTDIQLLSISIDALGDTPATLAAWQARFGRHVAWRTAVADVAQVDRLVGFMRGVVGKNASHTMQVFVFDRQGNLRYRSGDSPAIGDVGALLAHVATLS